jgi:hypothetical protein
MLKHAGTPEFRVARLESSDAITPDFRFARLGPSEANTRGARRF